MSLDPQGSLYNQAAITSSSETTSITYVEESADSASEQHQGMTIEHSSIEPNKQHSNRRPPNHLDENSENGRRTLENPKKTAYPHGPSPGTQDGGDSVPQLDQTEQVALHLPTYDSLPPPNPLPLPAQHPGLFSAEHFWNLFQRHKARVSAAAEALETTGRPEGYVRTDRQLASELRLGIEELEFAAHHAIFVPDMTLAGLSSIPPTALRDPQPSSSRLHAPLEYLPARPVSPASSSSSLAVPPLLQKYYDAAGWVGVLRERLGDLRYDQYQAREARRRETIYPTLVETESEKGRQDAETTLQQQLHEARRKLGDAEQACIDSNINIEYRARRSIAESSTEQGSNASSRALSPVRKITSAWLDRWGAVGSFVLRWKDSLWQQDYDATGDDSVSFISSPEYVLVQHGHTQGTPGEALPSDDVAVDPEHPPRQFSIPSKQRSDLTRRTHSDSSALPESVLNLRTALRRGTEDLQYRTIGVSTRSRSPL